MRKRKSGAVVFLSLLHIVSLLAIILVCYHCMTSAYLTTTIGGEEYTFANMIKISDDTYFIAGLAAISLLLFAGLFAFCTLIGGVVNGQKGTNKFSLLTGILLVIVAFLIFNGYEMFLNQLVDESGAAGTFLDLLGGSGTTLTILKTVYVTGDGYLMMGICASIAAGIEFFIFIANLFVRDTKEPRSY